MSGNGVVIEVSTVDSRLTLFQARTATEEVALVAAPDDSLHTGVEHTMPEVLRRRIPQVAVPPGDWPHSSCPRLL